MTLAQRFCIFYFAFMWIGFGTMHFTHHEQTLLQMPSIFPFPSLLVYITGVAEVVAGFLIFPKRTRKWAALTSLVLLVILIPAMVKILFDDSAIPADFAGRDIFRAIIIPGNLLLAACSWILWRASGGANKGAV